MAASAGSEPHVCLVCLDFNLLMAWWPVHGRMGSGQVMFEALDFKFQSPPTGWSKLNYGTVCAMKARKTTLFGMGFWWAAE